MAYPMDNRCIGDRQQMGHTTVAHPGHRGHKEEMSPPLSHKAVETWPLAWCEDNRHIGDMLGIQQRCPQKG